MGFINKDKIIKYLIIFLPVTLVLSIFFSEFILFIISLFFISDYLKKKERKKNFLYIFFIFFVIFFLFSSFLLMKVLF